MAYREITGDLQLDSPGASYREISGDIQLDDSNGSEMGEQPQAMADSAAPGPIVPGESISTITGRPVTEAEMLRTTQPSIPEYVGRPLIEGGGMILGGASGTAVPGPGTIAGGALGYAAGKNISDILYGQNLPQTAGQALTKTGQDIATGAAIEMSGPIIGRAAGALAKGAGRLGKEVLGSTTGAGPGMVEEAVRGSQAFKGAMRGRITGDEVVDNALGALQSLRNNRLAEYKSSLDRISQVKGNVDATPIRDTLGKLMKRYNVRIGDDGAVDVSRIAMGKKGRADISEMIDEVMQWGSKEGDLTPTGLDTLKRQLDDFYSDSSQARAFVSELRNAVKNTITEAVPEYGKMTKRYADATKIIKDIESNLMLRKQGMSGRITPDQTLRRLTSSMRENFEMRKELVRLLGEKSGEDIAGQVAGYSADQLIPRGLIGKVAGGSAGVLAYINPKFWPLLVASSPRAVGEFLTVYGKGLRQLQKASPALSKTAGFEAGEAATQ